jgi:nucleoside-diphosphate-sugar epimerase
VRRALHGVDVLHHLAAKVEPFGDPRLYFESNVLVTKRLLQAARHTGVGGVVYCSSASVVFNGSPIRGGTEVLPRRPLRYAPYARSKAMAEELIEAHAVSSKISSTILRPHLIWGPGDRHLLPGLQRVARVLRFVPCPGGSAAIVDPTHVNDVARAHVLATKEVGTRSVLGSRTYFVTGPDRIAAGRAIERLFAVQLSRHIPTVSMPTRLLESVALLAETASRSSNYRLQADLCRFTVRSLSVDQWFDGAAAERDLGYVGRIGL